MQDRRHALRERVLRKGSVVFNGRQAVLDCRIRNLSDTGALVRMSDWIELPATFELDVAGAEPARRVRQCWRRGDDVGVAFLKAEDCVPPAPIQLADVRSLRARRLAASAE
jgi:hypothetical protein